MVFCTYCCTQYASKFGKLSSGHRAGKGQFSFQSQRKAMPKDAQVQFNHSVVSDSVTPWTAAHQASLFIINSWSLLKVMSTESVMLSNHLILCHSLLLPPSIFPNIGVFSNESALHIRWPHIKKQRHYFANKSPSSQGYGFSSSHVYTWELDYKESWVPKNWCFWTVVLEKTLESPLDCKEIQLVHPKGVQSWVFIGRTDAEAETPIIWPPDAKNWLIWKEPDAGKDWRQEEKGMTEDEMTGWHHRLSGHEFE